jgi:ribosomal protein L40E
MRDEEAHVCMTCGAKGYGGWNCQQCGSVQLAMTGKNHEATPPSQRLVRRSRRRRSKRDDSRK